MKVCMRIKIFKSICFEGVSDSRFGLHSTVTKRIEKRTSDNFNANLSFFLTNYCSFLAQQMFHYFALIGRLGYHKDV